MTQQETKDNKEENLSNSKRKKDKVKRGRSITYSNHIPKMSKLSVTCITPHRCSTHLEEG